MTKDEEENLNNLIYIKETGSFSGGPVVKNLPTMQGTLVQSLVWEEPTCCGAIEPMHHNSWACTPRALALRQEKPPH